jgi:hypothetical protein
MYISIETVSLCRYFFWGGWAVLAPVDADDPFDLADFAFKYGGLIFS